MGKNNLLNALKELQSEGLSFALTYSRGPFFLKGSQQNIDEDNAQLGCPKDAPNWMTTAARVKQNPQWGLRLEHMNTLMSEAGLSPRNKEVTDNRVMRSTMDAHRLAQYAATESNEKGERMWFALSRRWFMGKDTMIRPVKLDGRDLLIECAEFAGLDMQKVQQVLDGGIVSQQEIVEQVQRVHAVGINSIPLLVFEVQGLASGTWREDPRLQETKYRALHHGSGSKAAFKQVLKQLHAATANLPATVQLS